MCLRPKSMGGLGIKDIDKFKRALRLRWLWNAWDSNPRQWTQLLRIPDPTDRALFFSSTYIQVGDGRNTPFWEAKWLNAATLKDIAPNLYKMARMKNRIVFAELHNHSWIKNLREINSSIMLEEYIMLFIALSTVTLTDQEDQIFWWWTANGKYSAASAYTWQFNGAVTHFPAHHICWAKV
jgi:hypothetical protein